MSSRSRFNLAFLRAFRSELRNTPAIAWLDELKVSRRIFLGFSAATSAGSAVARSLRGEGFSVVREGRRVHVLLHDKPRWTIDPSYFGTLAKVDLLKRDSHIGIVLSNAFFPGTTLPADFDSVLFKRVGIWTMKMEMACGIRVDGALLEWLDSQVAAFGRWRSGVLRPFDGLKISFTESPRVRFTPDWSFEILGAAKTSVKGLQDDLRCDSVRIELRNPNPETQIIAGPPAPQTSFSLSRSAHPWRVNLRRDSEEGWSLAHDEEDLFDELRIEAAQTPVGPAHSALLYQSANNTAQLRFFPGGGLISDLGESFHLPLTKPRLAFSLGEVNPTSALIAETDRTPLWAHASDVSFLFAGSVETPHFELLDGNGTTSSTPHVIPSLCEICFPDDATCTTLKFDVPRPVPFTWADLVAPFERFWGHLHLLPSQHNFNFLLDAGDRLQIDRPSDLLSLGFQFKGMKLQTGWDARIVPSGKDANPQVTVIFPPQHIAEEAFYHSADGIPDTSPFTPGVPIGVSEYRNYHNDPTANPTQAQIDALKKILDPDYATPPTSTADESSARALLAGESKLVFSLPPHKREVPFHLKGLLDWTNWTQVVSGVAKFQIDAAKLPAITNPANPQVTSIELPWRVNLSPSDLACWAHSVHPARYKTEVTELWHTRLSVRGKKARDANKPFNPTTNFEFFPDETNTKDRTVRAIWSPDFVAVQIPTCSGSSADPFPPHYTMDSAINPFRMSLDAADRNDLVHLTSNYFIPTQATLCSTGNPLTDPHSEPLAVAVERMMLTSMGGYLTSFGSWNPAKVDINHTLTVQQWKHIATLGRDQYARVVYKGFLLPFGIPASLVKVTERVFQTTSKGVVAVLHQHMYIVIQNPIKQCRVLGEPNMGREFNFSTVEALTLVTPYLDSPSGDVPSKSSAPRLQNQTLFWPQVGGKPFFFRFRFTDVARGVSEASLPVVFADASVAQTEGTGHNPFGCTDAINLYNRGSNNAANPDQDWTATPFSDQKVAFAESSKLGDTQYDTNLLRWRVDPLPVTLSGHIAPSLAATVTLSEINSGFAQSVSNDGNGNYVYPLLAPGTYNVSIAAAGYYRVVSSQPFTLQGHDDATLDVMLTALTSPQPGPTVLTPTTKPGKVGAIDLYRRDLPFFYPAVDYARVSSSSIKRITGNTYPTRVVFFPGYLASGFNAKKNRGEVILQVEDDQPLNLTFGANNHVTQAGGLSNPDASIVGFSRQTGPVGGTHNAAAPANPANISAANPRGSVSVQSLSTFSTGNFNPASFFGGLASAKILGAVKLSDIIAPLASGLLSNLDKAPQMLEQSLFTLENALDDVVDTIKTFQGITEPGTSNQNVIAKHLEPNAQAVYNAQAQKSGNAIDEVIADAELVNAVVQYATALEALLKNPSALAQEMLLDELTALIDSAWVQQLAAQFINFRNAFTQQLNSALATLLTLIEDKTQATLASIATVTVVDTIYGLAQGVNIATGVQKAFSDLAPNLEAVRDLVATVNDVRSRITAFVSTAGSVSAANAPISIPALFDDITGILDDLLEIYQCAGFLGLVTVDQSLLTNILNAETDVQNLWLGIDYLQAAAVNLINTAVDKIATEYSILASSDDVATARQILQNVRQLQRSTQALLTYAKQIDAVVHGDASTPPHTLNAKEVRRQVELVQQLQQDVLSSLAALQTISNRLPPLPGGGVDPRIAQLTSDVNAVVPLLTIADQLTASGTIEGKLAVVVATNPALAARAADLQAQLTGLRQQLQSDAGNVALKLQHYALSLAYQGSCAAVAEWNAYLAEPALKAALTAVQGLNTLATTVTNLTQVIGGVICNIGGLWQNFRAALAAAATVGPLIEGLFAASIQGVDDALAAICNPQESNPSLLLHKSHQLVSAFDTLIADVRSRVNNVAGIAEFYVTHAQALLPLILAQLPIPTSVSLSYDWTPDIQDWEPVFTLEEGASFTVSAAATVALANLTTQPAIQPSFDISATLTKFSINLIGTPSFVIVDVESLQFTSQGGNTPNCHLKLNGVRFGDAMQFAQSLAAALDPSEGPFVELADASLRAGFRFGLPVITMGAFTIMQLAIEVAVALPFNGDPVRCELGISDQQQPFLLSCGIYGGGGFLQLQLGLDGVQLLQGALEFGLVAAISIGPLQGDGFVVAGIYFRISASDATVCGFVHAHGHMDIFGLITLDVDLYVSTCYDSATGAVSGTATFTVQVSIMFFSESFSLSAQYSFGGSGPSSNSSSHQISAKNIHGLPSRPLSAQPDAVCATANNAPNSALFVDQQVWTEYFNAFVA